jgi:GSH-dependent disulfide-bond oxidoreductase
MIDLYFWTTPNGYKVSILLEELEMPYRTIPVNIGAGEQFAPEFLKISPNNRIPAIVDTDGPNGQPYALFESGAILLYLAEKAGRLLPTERGARYRVIEWLMFQMANVGPMLGQNHHFRNYAPERIEYAVNRYTNETQRLYGVMDRRLKGREHFADDYSVADIAIYPWLRAHERQGVDLGQYPDVKRWLDAMSARPAVERGLAVLADQQRAGPMDERAKQVLFGAEQYQRR